MRRPSNMLRLLPLSFFLAVLGAVVLITARTRSDPHLPFLPPEAGAAWIVYPSVPDVSAHPSGGTNTPVTVFEKSFSVANTRGSSLLRLKALQAFSVVLNGKTIGGADTGIQWRQPTQIDLGPLIRAGTNTLRITVTNAAGPPLLWCALSLDGTNIGTDSSWTCSCNEAASQSAHIAAEPRLIRPGDPVYSTETALHALRGNWLRHSIIFALCALAIVAAQRTVNRAPEQLPSMIRFVVPAIVALWAVLLVQNLRLVSPSAYGFDARSHLGYISFIQTEHALPGSREGWETHQPPLYYAAAAVLLKLFSLDVGTAAGLLTLRVLSFAIVASHVILIWASLRLLFPGELRKPLIGTVAAAFLPLNLYHAHFITNENLLALFVSASFYLALKLMLQPKPSPALSAALGMALGCALLTKISAIVVVPIVFAAVAARFLVGQSRDTDPNPEGKCPALAPPAQAQPGPFQHNNSPVQMVLTLVICAAACALVCGWYYVGHWSDIVDIFGGQSKFAYGTGWWQEDGYRTSGYYTRFGEALVRPLFSGFHSFWDGLYSTVWGDGLCGGSVSIERRPPWNYDLLLAGYILAIVPTICWAAGAVVGCMRLLRHPSPGWWMVIGSLAGLAFAMIYFSLAAPGISQVRASFALMMGLPFCALLAIGADRIASLHRAVQVFVLSALGCWAINSYTTYAVSRTSAQPYVADAAMLLQAGRFEDAARLADEAHRRDPANGTARSVLADAWAQMGRRTEARQLIMEAVQRSPNDIMAHVDASFELAQSNQLEEAIVHARRAVELGPDSPPATKQLAMLLVSAHHPDAASACRDALRVRPLDSEVRAWLKQLGER